MKWDDKLGNMPDHINGIEDFLMCYLCMQKVLSILTQTKTIFSRIIMIKSSSYIRKLFSSNSQLQRHSIGIILQIHYGVSKCVELYHQICHLKIIVKSNDYNITVKRRLRFFLLRI